MVKYDLVVVGSSFASSFFLKKYLSKATADIKVLVLERGHLFPHAQRLKEKKGEIFTPVQELVTGNNGIINNNKAKPWEFQVAFGGNSNCWTGCTPRFMPNDFRLKSLYGVGADWPLTYEELEPYYDEVEEIMSISGPDNTPFPKKNKYPQPPHLFSSVDQVLHQTYGNLYINQPTARARVAVNGRNPCCVSNTCEVCPMNAKFTIENSLMSVYEDERVSLVYGAHVLNLELEGDLAKGVNYLKDGKEETVNADIIALGANAIFNAHILLSSGDKTKKTGKGLGEQVGLEVEVLLKDLSNVGGSTMVTANGYMLYDGEHRKEAAACLIESSNAFYIRMERGRYRDIVRFRMVFEDLPDDDNHVSLSTDTALPAVHFKGFSDYTTRGIERMKKKLPEVLSCLPVEEIKFFEPFPSEAHILGTTRMSAVPADGVVDKHLIHHQYRNLFVLGSGSFPSYSPSNPTLTLSALSLLAADKSF